MTKSIEDIHAYNEDSWQELCWAISNSEGEFSLILAHCNSVSLQQKLTHKLQTSCSVKVREMVLDKSTQRLYKTIQAQLDEEYPQALIVFGLESVKELDAVLKGANQVREEFRKNFPFPVVLWVTDEVVQKLIRIAHDLQTWATTVDFAIATDYLIEVIQKTADKVFTKVLEAGAGRFLNNNALNLGIGSPQRMELEVAQAELKNRNIAIQPELEAGLEFVLGRDIGKSLENSLQHYEQSLLLLSASKSPQILEKRACVLYSMGLSWRTYAALYRNEYNQACEKAQDCFKQCTTVFEQANRSDLVANFINSWGEVLQRLEKWTDLETLSKKALNLHQTYTHQFRLARAYGFLAEVMLNKSAVMEAKENAQKALEILENATSSAENSLTSTIIADLEWERSYHRGWYLYTLAKSQLALNEIEEAIKALETAKLHTKHQYDPELYIWILAELRNCYFRQHQYLKAFRTKQKQRSLEQQYGFRAFIGAGRLQPKQQVSNPGLALTRQQGTVAQEIAASGRQQDIKRFVERIGRHDHKLTVIHGQSGVGKSSILQAGLIPVLQNKSIGTRDVVTVLQQVYTDWVTELGKLLTEALNSPRFESKQEVDFNSLLENRKEIGVNTILKQLQKNAEHELLTVIVFDQFEEFFFVYKDVKQRLIFYKFLRQCLDVAHVRVILSLREDYLYYLLECNNRFIDFEVINNNILDKDILYYLGNFSPSDTKLLINKLTKTTQLLLEPTLIDALVEDLAGELDEVRPIELQVVGTQLQTEEISTLAKYQERGPKEELVARFLEEVVKDCGEENQQITKLVLYLLTDENNTRPLKTRADLEMELEVVPEKLDLILIILVKSGLIFKIPSVPNNRYQLVHDYLVPFVRQQQSARLIAELEKEREQRKLTEAKLLKATQRQLRQAYIAGAAVTVLAILTGTFGVLASIGQTNSQLQELSSSSKLSLRVSKNLDSLIESLKAAKQLKSWSSIGVTPKTKMQVITALQDAVHTIRERNSLEGHNDAVSKVSFSADGNMVVSGGADGEVKIWSRDGRELETFQAHDKKITSIIFSPDGQKLITGSEDKTLKLWNLQGKQLSNTFIGHKDSITSVAFSPNGNKIVSGSKDNTVKIWDLDGKVIKNLDKHEGSITSVSFSPDGELIASGSRDKTLKLWDLKGKVVQNIKHGNTVNSIGFSPDGETIASTYHQYNLFLEITSFTNLWRLDGTLIKTIESENGNLVQSIKFSLDGKRIAFMSDRSRYDELEDVIYIKIIGINTGEQNNFTLTGHRNKVNHISFIPNLEALASASEDRTVKIWEIKSKKNKNNFKLPNETVNQISFSPNSILIATSNNYGNEVNILETDGISKTTLPGENFQFAFSYDSRMLVSGSQDTKTQLWHRNGTFIRNIQDAKVDQGLIYLSNKTTALIKQDNKVELLESNGKQITTLDGHIDKVYQVKFSEDETTVVTASKDKTIKIWQRNGKLISTFKVNSDNIQTIIFSPDKQIIATEDDNKTIKIWQRNGTLIKTINNVHSAYRNINFSSNSENIAIWTSNNTVKFLRRDGKEIRTLKSEMQMSVMFSPNNEIVAISKIHDRGRSNVELRRMDGRLIKTLPKLGLLSEVRFTSDSQAIVTYDYLLNMKFWKLDGTLISSFKSIAFSSLNNPNIQTLVTFEDNNRLKLWQRNGTLIKTIQLKTKSKIQNFRSSDNSSNNKPVYFSPNGKILAIQSDKNNIELWRIDGTFIKIIKVNQNKEDQSPDSRESFFADQNTDLDFSLIDFSSDSRTLAIATDKNTVEIRKLDNKASLVKTIKTENAVQNIYFIPDSDTVGITTGYHTAKLWQLTDKTNKEPKLLQTFPGHKNKVTGVSISPNSQLIASASEDNTVKLWQPNSKLLRTFKEHANKVNSVSFSPDGKLIASASDDKTVKIWQPADGKVIKSCEGHTKGVKSTSFSPDGKMIASVGKDNTVRLWNIEGKDCKSLKPLNSGDSVNGVSFSPDSQLIAVSSESTIRLWSLNGTRLASLEGLGGKDVSFSPDGKSIAAAGEKGISVWDFHLDTLIKRGCNWAHDYLKNNPNVEKSDRTLCDDVK